MESAIFPLTSFPVSDAVQRDLPEGTERNPI